MNLAGGPATQLVLVNASSVKRDALPGKGDKLLLSSTSILQVLHVIIPHVIVVTIMVFQ